MVPAGKRLPILVVVVHLIAAGSVNGFKAKNSGRSSRDTIIPRSFTLASNCFGLNLLGQLNSHRGSTAGESQHLPSDNVRKNILISPLSITASLTMLYLATEEGTQASHQIEQVLAFGLAWPASHHHEQPDRQRIRQLIRKAMLKAAELKSFRTVMANQTLRLNLDYARLIQDHFNAQIIINQDPNLNGLEPMPMENDTHYGRLWPRDTAAEIESSNGIGLLDYAYFHGAWQYRFDVANTRPGIFIGANRVFYENVPFMRLRAAVPVVPMDEIDAAMVELPFKDGPFAMYGILPARTTDDLALIRRSLNPWYIESTIRRLQRYGRITVEFPTFGIEAIMDLRSPLQRMGLTDIFQMNRARLDSMATGGGIYLKEFRHKVRMEVRENGVSAMDNAKQPDGPGKQPKRIDPNSSALAFDHPFLYFIRHTRTGVIVLIGEIHGF